MLRPRPRYFHTVTAIVALAVAVASTWPIAPHVRDHLLDGARVDPKNSGSWWAQAIGADVFTTAWILNWDLHGLFTQPLHLFDANIFHPAPLALARSEHMIATALLGLPGALLDGPVTAHQTALLLCVLLNVWSMAYVVARWSGSLAGGLVAGTLYGVSPFHQHEVVHLQSLGTAYFPLMLFAADRIATDRAWRWIALGAGALALQMLSGQYLAFMALITWSVAAAVGVVIGQRGHRFLARAQHAGLLASGTALAVIVVLPFVIPYVRLTGAGELPDNSQEWLLSYGMRLRDYVFPFFPTPERRGAWILAAPAALALAIMGALALFRGERASRRRLVMLVLIGLAGACLSVGPRPSGLGFYTLANRMIPGFRTMRYPSRFALMPHLAIAMLGGIGTAELVRRAPRTGTVIATLLVASALTRYWRGPVPLRPIPVGKHLPPAYSFLATSGEGGPLLELPALSFPEDWRDAERAFFSTFHWLPLLNGRTGYPPPSYRLVMTLAAKLPDSDALERLRAMTGVRWVLVHCDSDSMRHRQATALCGRGDAMPGRSRPFGDMWLYDLTGAPNAPVDDI